MRSMITKRMIKMTLIFIGVMLLIIFIFQVYDCQKDVREESGILFGRITEIMDNNEKELDEVVSEYNSLCLNYADAVAYILQQNPSAMDDVDELNKIAAFMQVDEIHIFDETGTIVKGSIPKYYNMTIYDGDQIGFFAPMFEDKSLRLCQEVTPNTSEGKEMQYAAVWNETGDYVVQIGVVPKRVLEVINKNQIPYIFSNLTVGSGTEVYAVDADTGEIIGATDESRVGQNFTDMGINKSLDNLKKYFHSSVFGTGCFCSSYKTDSVILIRTCTNAVVYENMIPIMLLFAVCLLAMAGVLVYAIVKYLDTRIVKSIGDINSKLSLITDGKFDERVSVSVTPEFEELSTYINEMIKSVLGFTDKISYVLDLAQLKAGVYEYNTKMKKVRVTNQIRNILDMGDDEEKILSDSVLFEEYINGIKKNPVPEAANSYRMNGDTERYVRMESFKRGNSMMGIMVDVTDTVLQARRLEEERDKDILTGLYNRRGLESRMDAICGRADDLKCSALIMIDADDLKEVNDKYGHGTGDLYLCEIANVIGRVTPPHSILSRQGGDEFILFYYGAETEAELLSYINELKEKRDCDCLTLDSGEKVTIRYSIGYVLGFSSDYEAMMREADKKMYADKSSRKDTANNYLT